MFLQLVFNKIPVKVAPNGIDIIGFVIPINANDKKSLIYPMMYCGVYSKSNWATGQLNLLKIGNITYLYR